MGELFVPSSETAAKKIELGDYRAERGVPIPRSLSLIDFRSGQRSTISIDSVEVNEGLDEELFSPFALERAGR